MPSLILISEEIPRRSFELGRAVLMVGRGDLTQDVCAMLLAWFNDTLYIEPKRKVRVTETVTVKLETHLIKELGAIADRIYMSKGEVIRLAILKFMGDAGISPELAQLLHFDLGVAMSVKQPAPQLPSEELKIQFKLDRTSEAEELETA